MKNDIDWSKYEMSNFQMTNIFRIIGLKVAADNI